MECAAKKLTNHHQVELTDGQKSLSTPVSGLEVALALTAAIENREAEVSDASKCHPWQVQPLIQWQWT